MKSNGRSVGRLGVVFALSLTLVFLGCPNPAGSDDTDSGSDPTDLSSGDGSSATEAILLSVDEWSSHSLTAGNQAWFVAEVTAGSSYRVTWDDWDTEIVEDEEYADIVLSAYQEDQTTDYFTESDFANENDENAYYESVSVPSGDSRLYVMVEGLDDTETGYFRVKLSSASSDTTDETSDTSTDPDDAQEDETETEVATDASITAVAIASDAGEAVTLSSSFSADTTEYTATVAHEISSVTVSVTASDDNATITVNETEVASDGSGGAAVDLSVGENTITAIATAEDETTTKTYSFTVTREEEASTATQLSEASIISGDTLEARPAFSSDGKYMYVAAFADDFIVYDVSDPAAVTEIARLSDTFDYGNQNRVLELGGNVWVLGSSYTQVFDVSTPASPEEITPQEGTTSRFGEGNDAVLSSDGSTLYIAGEYSGLEIWDISDLSTASKLGETVIKDYYYDPDEWDADADATETVYSLELDESADRLFLGHEKGLAVVDVSDSSNPTQLDIGGPESGSFSNDPTYSIGGATHGFDEIQLVGDTLYVAGDSDGFIVMDVSDLSAITRSVEYDIDSLGGDDLGISRLTDLFIDTTNNKAYCADFGEGLYVLDITTPSAPVLEATYIRDTSSFINHELVVSPDYELAFLARGSYSEGHALIELP